jgi:hypothetical protein
MRRLTTPVFVVCASLALALSVRADEPKAIVEKAIRAHGGEAALARTEITRVQWKGTFEWDGVTGAVTIESLTQLPNRFRSVNSFDVMGQKDSVGIVYDGEKAWMTPTSGRQKQPPRPGAEPTGALLDEVRQLLHARRVESLLPLLRDKTFELSALPEIKVGDKPALGVKVSAKGMRDCSLYFDKESGLLVRTARKSLDLFQKEVDLETTYSAWQQFDGLKLPVKLVMHQSGKKLLEAELVEYKFLDKVDPAEFLKP